MLDTNRKGTCLACMYENHVTYLSRSKANDPLCVSIWVPLPQNLFWVNLM